MLFKHLKNISVTLAFFIFCIGQREQILCCSGVCVRVCKHCPAHFVCFLAFNVQAAALTSVFFIISIFHAISNWTFRLSLLSLQLSIISRYCVLVWNRRCQKKSAPTGAWKFNFKEIMTDQPTNQDQNLHATFLFSVPFHWTFVHNDAL